MSIGLVGGAASELWNFLKESRIGPSSNPAPSPAPVASPASIGQSASAKASTSANGVSDASAKIVADLKSLLISLQSGSNASTPGSTATADASNAASATSATASGATAASGAPSGVLSDLKSLFGDLGKVNGHGAHHHRHGPPPSGASPAAGSSQQPDSRFLQGIAKALTAYASHSSGSSVQASTAITA